MKVLLKYVTLIALGLTSLGAVIESAQAADRRVWVVNNTSYPMTALYGSRASTSSWENQILRRRVASGDEVRVNFDDGTGACIFDLRAVFSNGSFAEKFGYNVCTGDTWTIYD